MERGQKPRILVAPLDWGLGHATRCIPIIRELLNLGCEPWIAASGLQKEMLQSDFPAQHLLDLAGYGIQYDRDGKRFGRRIMMQVPRILNSIRKERLWLAEIHKNTGFQGIISDNRYGLHHPEIPSVFITHQLSIKTGRGEWTDRQINKWNQRAISQFDACWVPDWAGSENLAGELSHPAQLPVNTAYIGPLSRLEEVAPMANLPLLVILSGPEPQRTLFENLLLQQLGTASISFVLVRGVTHDQPIPEVPGGTIYNNQSTKQLNQRISDADFVLCRPGYTSIMDLVKLKKKMILVPTPGQAEQEYLFEELMAKKMAVGSTQDQFNLNELMIHARDYDFWLPGSQKECYKSVLQDWVSKLL